MQNTINNCWIKADILSKDNDGEVDLDFDAAEKQVYYTHMNELGEIQELIDKLNIENPLTAKEYV